MKYPIAIEPGGKSHAYGVVVPDLPGCFSAGDTIELAYENAKEAVRAMGLSVEVKYITDMQKIMEYGVMSMPALVVNEKVVSQGKVLKAADVEKLLSRKK